MSIQNRIFPYPVLRLEDSDYKNSRYISEIDIIDKDTYLLIEFYSKFDNIDLKKLLKEDRIEFLYRIESPKTYFRRIIKTTNSSIQLKIYNNDLSGKVRIDSMIVAKEKINKFYSHDFHKDFKDFEFNFDVANIIGIGKSLTFTSDKNMDSLYSTESIFSIVRRDADQDDGMRVDINSKGKIQVSLSKLDYNKYATLVGNMSYTSILNTMIVLPALVWVFENIRHSSEFYESNQESRWLKSIDIVLESSNLKLTPDLIENISSIGLAQKLLGMPLNRSLDSLSNRNIEEEFR